jgi:hypothetical protein
MTLAKVDTPRMAETGTGSGRSRGSAVTRVSAAFARLFNFLHPKPTELQVWWNEREHNFSLRKQARAQGQTFVSGYTRKKAGR